MKSTVTVALWISSYTISCAQITVREFVSSAQADATYVGKASMENYLSKKNYRLPLLQKVELRTKMRELDQEKQTYGLRLSPVNPWEQQRNHHYFQSLRKQLELERQQLLKTELLKRYHLVIDVIIAREMKEMGDEQLRLQQQALKMRQDAINSDKFDADKFLSLQTALWESELEKDEQEEKMSQLHLQVQLLSGAVGDSIHWRRSSIIPIRIICSSLTDSITDHPSLDVLLQRQKLAVAQKEFALKRSNINLGFIQAEYDQRKKDDGQRSVHLSAGITLPIARSNKTDLVKARLKMEEEEQKVSKASSLVAPDVWNDELLRGKCKQYFVLEERLQRLSSSASLSSSINLTGGNPLSTIQYRLHILNLQQVLAKLYQKILHAYLDSLAAKEKIQALPLRNVLSADGERL